jgi:hypothetical protein
MTCSFVYNYSLHSGLFPSVLNIIHVFDLESVCLIPNIYIIIYYSWHVLYPILFLFVDLWNVKYNIISYRTIPYRIISYHIINWHTTCNMLQHKVTKFHTLHHDSKWIPMNLSFSHFFVLGSVVADILHIQLPILWPRKEIS